MRTVGEMRKAMGIKAEYNKDSIYQVKKLLVLITIMTMLITIVNRSVLIYDINMEQKFLNILELMWRKNGMTKVHPKLSNRHIFRCAARPQRCNFQGNPKGSQSKDFHCVRF